MEKHTPQENSIEKRKAIINKLMHFVEQSLDTRLSNIERLMEKNKKGLSKAKTEFSKIETIVNIYSESRQSNKISDEIRLFFALARNERLDVISSSNNMEQLRSRSKKAVSHLSRSPGLPSSYNSQFTLKEENKSKKTSFFGTTGRTEEDSRRKSPVFSSSKRTIQEENRSATPKRLQIGTKYEVNMPRTEGKSPRPLEPIANEAIRQSINRLYPKPDPASIANGIAKPTPTSKLLAERDRKKSLTLTSLKPGIVPTEAKLISTPNRTPTNTGRGRISPKPITPKNEIGSKLAPKSNSGLSIKYGDKTLDITPKLGSQSPTLSSKKIRQQAQDSTLSQNGKTEKWIQPHTSNRHSRKIIPEIKEEAEDLKGIPRVSSRVRAENPPTFSEAGESSKMPTRIVTPNNLSSFIELLNYNSDSDEDKGFGDTSKISLTKKSKDERDKDTTQDFIREALATMKSDKSAADNKGFSISQSKSLLQKWEKLPVEAVEGHKMSSFAGLPNYKPIKHSTRLVVCAPCSMVFDELFPLVRLNDL